MTLAIIERPVLFGLQTSIFSRSFLLLFFPTAQKENSTISDRLFPAENQLFSPLLFTSFHASKKGGKFSCPTIYNCIDRPLDHVVLNAKYRNPIPNRLQYVMRHKYLI